jgi:hypothetical protein
MHRAVADHLAQAAYLRRHVDEALPAEARVHRHHADEVAEVEHMLDRLRRRAGVQRDARLHPGPRIA